MTLHRIKQTTRLNYDGISRSYHKTAKSEINYTGADSYTRTKLFNKNKNNIAAFINKDQADT
jgi:hypothetical protein